MAVGRITGPLLAKNLLRDGIDLSVETDLLYLDVTNNRIGIRTGTPQYALDVNGDTNVLSLKVVTTSTLGGLSISTSNTGSTTLSNATGSVVIETPVEKSIVLKNNTFVDGNLHATGNITANGSVQIGNNTGSDTLSLYADIVSNVTPQTPNQYNLGAENLPWANVYAQSVVADAFRSPKGQELNLYPDAGGTANIRGNIRVWGNNPLGTAPVTTNVLYVTMDGSDTNDGTAMDPSRACRTISGAVKSPFYKEGTSIKVAPGRYFENNPIELKPLTSVIGSDLRTTFVEPINKTQDLFWVKSGCYIAQMQMSNGQSGLLPGGGYINGTNRGAYAVAFKPNFGGEKIDVFYSPYVQNCTNQSGPWLQDGTMFIPNQTVQIPEAVGTGTWVSNTTTMVVYVNEGTLRVGQSINVGPTPPGFVNARTLLLANKAFLQEQVIAYIDQKYEFYGYNEEKCKRDTGLIIDSLVTDLVFSGNGYTQSNFAGLQYWNQNGYTGQIPTEITPTTAAINYVSSLAQKVVVNDTTGTRYQSTITQSTGTAATIVEVADVYEDFSIILNILSSGTAGVTDLIQPNGISVVSANAQNAATLLLDNKSYIQAEAVAYVDANFGTGFTYNQAKCGRDIGLIVDSLALDLAFGGDTQTVFSGLSYWNQSGYTGAIASEITTTTNAIEFIRGLAQEVVVNFTAGPRYQTTVTQVTTITTATAFEQTVIGNNFGVILNILNTGTAGYSDIVVTNGINASTTASVVNAYNNLLANKAYIQTEAVAYVESTKTPGFVYDQAKCYRDMGYIVDSIAFDLLYGGNLQSVHSGVYYYGFNGATALPGEQTEAVAAYTYLKSIADEIILGNVIASPYQNTVTQVVTVVGSGIEVNSVRTNIDKINNIIVNGPAGYTPTPISLTRTTNVNALNAAQALKANKSFLQAELVAYINQTYGAFSYDREKCARDVGYMIDSVAFDVLYGGNRQAVHSGVYYYGFSETASAIDRERPQTTAAYYRIKDIVQKVVTNQPISKSPGNVSSQNLSLPSATIYEAEPLRQMVDKITDIINAGPSIADAPQPVSLVKSTDANVIKAADILIANRQFIIDEVIGYIEYTYNNGFAYNQPKCARDTGLIVDSIAFDMLYGGKTQSTFSGLQYWNQGNYTGQIPSEITATIAAIDYVSLLAQQVIVNGTGTRYQSTVTQVIGFTYDQVKCSRDTGLIVDAVAQDLLFNGETQATFAGVQYWNHDGYVGNIASELTTTTNAISYVSGLVQKVLINSTVGPRYQSTVTQNVSLTPATSSEQSVVETDFGVILDILANGVAGVTDKIVPNGLTANTNVNVQNAFAVIQANKAYIQAEAVAYVDTTMTPGYTYDPAKCYRDVGYMVDSVSFDLLYGGNLQAIESGVYYYGFNPTSTALPNEQTQAVAAYNYLRGILPNVIQGVPLGVTYQSTVPQVTSGPVGTPAEVTAAQAKIDIITNIITNGPGVANAPAPIGLTRSSDVNIIGASTILKANRDFLRAELIAFINAIYGPGATAAEIEYIADEFGIITSILENGTVGVTDIIVPNGNRVTNGSVVSAYNTLLSNKAYIQAETVAFVNSLNKIFDTAKCYRDTALVVDAITQDLLFSTSSQATFAGLQYWNQTSTEEIIPNELTTTTNAITYIKGLAQKVVVGDTSGARYSTGTQVTGLTTATSAEQVIIGNDFDVILNILSSGTAGVTDLIIPNGLSISPDANVQNAYALLQANREYLTQEAVAYVEATKTPGYVYDQTLCARDTGYMVDSVAFDLLYTGNRQAVQSGVYYYGFSGTSSAIPGESANTVAAFNKLKEVVAYVVSGSVLPVNYQNTITQVVSVSTGSAVDVANLQASVDLINTIITSGPGVVTAKTPISLVESATTSTLNAVSLLQANRAFITAEVLGYISNPSNFQYDPAKCYRDVGYMIDSVAFDLITNGNRQAVQSGVYYYDFNGGATAVPNEIPQVTAAYNHIRNIVGKILTNQPVTKTSGNTATQVTLASTATTAEITLAYTMIDEITNIINNGPSVAGPKAPIGLTATTTASIVAAHNLLLANREFIKAETIAFTNQFDTGFTYNRAKCRRDVGIILENVAYDVAFGGNEKSREAGLAYWNGVTSVIQGEILETADAIGYLDTLSQSVITNTTATNLLNTYQSAPQVFNRTLNDAGIAGGILTKLYGIIADIVQNGPTVAPTRQVGSGPDWGTVSAEVLLQTNRSFIQNEIISWINYNYPNFKYREDKCYRDVGFIIDAVTQDLVVNGNAKSIEAAKTYWTGNINVLENASFGNENQVPETVAAINRVRDIALQVVANNTVTTTSFVFNPGKCYRDTGLIVDALAQDLLFGGDSQTTFAGIQYWNHGGYVGDVASQLTTTTAAINYISDLAQKCLVNDISGTRYQNTVTQVTALPAATVSEVATVAKNFNTVTDILLYGVEGVTNKIIPNGITKSGNVNVQRAFNILEANIPYLQAEAIAWVNSSREFNYNQEKCSRDVGLIVDAIAQDLLFNGETQATFAGVQYWNQDSYVGNIAGELTTTSNAISYVNTLVQLIVTNNTGGARYQNTVTQNISLTPGTVNEQSTINTEFGLILDILNNGVAGVTDRVVPNGLSPVGNTDVLNAYAVIQANKAYIQAEAVAYVETTKTPGFAYDQAKCYRDVGYMVDSVSFDLLYGGNLQAIESGVYYYGFNPLSTALPGEQTQAVAAYNYLKSILGNIITNTPIGRTYQEEVEQVILVGSGTASEVTAAGQKIDIITDIVLNGPTVANAPEPISLTRSSNTSVINAAAALHANRDFLRAEIVAYVNATFVGGYSYDKAKCLRDSNIIVNAIALDLAFPTASNSQATISGLSYWNQNNGYTGAIATELTTTTNAINYVKDLSVKVVQNITSGVRYQNTITQTISTASGTVEEASSIINDFSLITTILSSGTAGITDLMVPNGISASTVTSVIAAYDLLRSNREYILAEAIAYVEQTKSPDFVYDPVKCYRDVGYMVDSVSFDLLHGGNRQAIQSGLYYFNFNAQSTAIPNEIPQVTAAFQFIKTISGMIAQNIAVTPLQTAIAQDLSLPAANPAVVPAVEDPAYKIINIIERGPDVVTTKEPINLNQTSDVDRLRAARILEANRAFIAAETIAYIDKYFAYQYDAAACARDVGYIVRSVAFDLLYGGNRQSIQSGVYYWGYTNDSTSLPKEQIASTLAYQYMKQVISKVVTGTLNTTTYQSTVTQVVNLPAGTSIEAEAIGLNIDKITTIINEGPKAAGPATPIGSTESSNQFVRNAVNLLHANRQFVQAEVIAYVQETQVSNDQIFLPFYDKGENASLGIIRNFGIITNIIQNGMGVAPPRSDGNGIFVRAGLSNNDVKIAPVVTAINTLSFGVYRVELSQSTIGYGDQQTLYFGETAVFPKLDDDVPDRWQQRRINPIGSMGGALIDGGVVSDRSPINSFVFDAFTQLNQGGIGVHITNNGYAQLVSVFTIFCSKSVIVENGGICSITNSNANFGDLCLIAKGYGRREFSGYISNPPILPYFPNGVYPSGGQVNVYIADPDLRPHISLVMEVEPPVGFINNQGLPGFLGGQTTIDVLSTGTIDITGVDTTGFVIGQEFYIRDQYGKQVDSNNQPYVRPGTIVADVNYETITLNYPLNSGGGEVGNFNFFNLYSCGKAYYTVLSSTVGADPIAPGTLLLPNQQNLQEGDSLMYINTLSQLIIQNLPVTAMSTGTQKFDYTLTGGAGAGQFITDKLNLMKSILVNGPSSAPRVERTGTLPSGAAAAASLLNQNRTFLQDEIIKYVDTTFFTFSYNQAKCGRDTGLVVDAVIADLLFGGDSQSTFAGIQYWNQDGYTGKIPEEITTTTAAIGYVKTLSQEIVRGIVGTRYSTGTQVTNLTLATAAEANYVGNEFDIILNILNSGTVGVTDLIVPNGIDVSTNVNARNAYALLQANKTYIQNEAVAFVESTKPGFHYDQTKCRRDAAIIIEGLALDLAFPTASDSQATFAGLSYWNQTGYTGAIASELTTTTNAINFVKGLVQEIVQNVTTGTRYSTGTQVTIPGSTGAATDLTKLNSEFDLIIQILSNGTAGVTDLVDSGGFKYNKTKCARDTGLIVDAIAQDMLFAGTSQSTFAGIQYWVQSGYVGSIAGELTTTTNAINWVKSIAQKVIENDTSGTRYATGQVLGTAAKTNEVGIVTSKFDTIVDILTNGVAGVTDKVEPNGLTPSTDIDVVNAYNTLLANKAYLQAEAVAYVEATKTFGFVYDQTKCARDVGYMIDSVAFDLLYGGNKQSIQSGVYYWDYSSSTSSIAGEIEQATAAYNYIKSILDNVVRGIPVTARQGAVAQVTSGTPGNATAVTQAQAKVDVITNIINNGPAVVTTKEPISLTASADANIVNGAKLLAANREFIQAEVIAYIDTVFPSAGIVPSSTTSTVNAYNLLLANDAFIQQEAVAYVEATKEVGFTYDQAKCARDVSYMVKSVAFDLLYGGNRQAIQSGVYYYDFSGSTAIPDEVSTTTAAFSYLSSIAQNVVKGIQVTPLQNRVTQVLSVNTGTAADAAELASQVTWINNIITTGPSVVTTKEPISLTRTASTSTLNAASLLLANKDFLVAETISYINQTYSFDYDQELCFRDVGYMVDSVSFDLLYGGNRQAVQSGVYYYTFDSTSTAIAGEIPQTTAAYNHIKDLVEKIIVGDIVTTQQSTVTQITNLPVGTSVEVAEVRNSLDRITSIINNGPDVVDAKTPISLTRSTSTSVINAAKMLEANRQFIVAETIAHVNNAYSVYNKAKCRRDVGLIVDALIYDLEKGGNYNSIVAAKSYYAQTGTFHITQLEENVTDPALFPDGAIVTFYQRSYMSASGYLFEYVGAGSNYGALPQRGIADPVQSKETVQLNNGKVFFTSTDQNGDFRIGPGLIISQATGVLSGRTFTKSLFANLTPFILAIES